MMVAIQRIVTRKRKEEMQNSSEGGHQEKIDPSEDVLKKKSWRAPGKNNLWYKDVLKNYGGHHEKIIPGEDIFEKIMEGTIRK